MGQTQYNPGYRIAYYHLPESSIHLINYALQQSDSYTQNTFQIENLEDLSLNRVGDLMSQPDVILLDENTEITEEMRAYAKKSLAQFIRVSENEVIHSNSNSMILSLSPEMVAVRKLTSDKVEMVSELQRTLNFIKDMAQISNTSKLRYMSQKVLQDEQEQVMSVDNKQEVIDTLLRLNQFIRLKDGYTQMHSEHVSEYAVMLAKELGLSQEEIHLIKIGGELHDIGKVGIPDAILQKQGRLTNQEFDIMKRHTIIGDAILPDREEFSEIRKMIRHHHERIDGHGYPDGLKGDEIPYFARILAVADTFDAMTTQRSYNRMKTLEEALIELQRSSVLAPNRFGELSQQLDPDLVRHFIVAIQKNPTLMHHFAKQDRAILEMRTQMAMQNEQAYQSSKGRMM